MSLVGRSQKGNRTYRYFVKWDDAKTGGRFFECSIVGNWNKGMPLVTVRTHTGNTGKYDLSSIFKIGCPPEVGDDVIAYWDNRPYAFKGKVT